MYREHKQMRVAYNKSFDWQEKVKYFWCTLGKNLLMGDKQRLRMYFNP